MHSTCHHDKVSRRFVLRLNGASFGAPNDVRSLTLHTSRQTRSDRAKMFCTSDECTTTWCQRCVEKL